jgi:pantetheine-phosphate adenylyltransferase
MGTLILVFFGMNRIAVFPGSFDPFTLGHYDVVMRAKDLFDKVYVAFGVNSKKDYLFSTEKRVDHVKAVFKNEGNIEVISYNKLTINLCEDLGANYIVRGIRNSTDLNYESSIAQTNSTINKDIETIFLITNPKYSAINSSIVRELYRNNCSIEKFIPEPYIL